MNIKLSGINVLWYPALMFWWGIFCWFTPAYWEFVWKITETGAPLVLNAIIIFIVLLLSVVLYVALIAVAIVVALAFTILTAVVWFLAAVLNGILHFTDWNLGCIRYNIQLLLSLL